MKKLNVETLNERAKYLRLLVYGEPGTGKTWFGASAALAPITAPVMFLSYRCQVASLRANEEYAKAIEDGRLVILELDAYKDLNYVHTWFISRPGSGHVKELDELFPEPPKTLVIDSVTELQRAEILRRAGNPVGKFLVDIEPPQIRDWGIILSQFTDLARLFYDFKVHVVFCGLEAVDYAERRGIEPPRAVGFRLAMQGKSQRQFPAYAMTVMRLTLAPRGSKYFNLGTTRAIKTATKEQSGCIPATIAAPSIPLLAKMLVGG